MLELGTGGGHLAHHLHGHTLGPDAPDGRGARLLEWSEPVAPGTTRGVTHYAFLLREADGTVQVRAEAHHWGLFPEATWLRLLQEAGFEAESVEEPPNGEHTPRRVFFGHKPTVG